MLKALCEIERTSMHSTRHAVTTIFNVTTQMNNAILEALCVIERIGRTKGDDGDDGPQY